MGGCAVRAPPVSYLVYMGAMHACHVRLQCLRSYIPCANPPSGSKPSDSRALLPTLCQPVARTSEATCHEARGNPLTTLPSFFRSGNLYRMSTYVDPLL